MMTVTDHDPEIMHGLGKFAVDLGPRNCYNGIRCKDIAYGILNKRRFVLIYIYIYIYKPFAVPEPLIESKSFEGNIIRNHELPHRENPRKHGPNSPKLYLRSQDSDVELAGTTGLH